MTRDDVNPSDYPAGTVIHNHPDWKYHAAPGLSSSALKTFVKQSPRHYQWRYVLQQLDRKETDAMLLGTLVHCLVLEGPEFERRYEQELSIEDYPDAMRTVPELKKYCEQHKLATTGIKQEIVQRILEQDPNAPVWDVLLSRQRQSRKRIVKPELWDRARRMRDGVMDNEDAVYLLKVGEPELSVWGSHEPTGQLIKCRADWFRPDGICADLKTCACSSPEQFARDCAKFGYDLQEVHYTTTLNSAGQFCNLFAFIAVESEPPYLCQVYQLKNRSCLAAQQCYEKAMKDLEECKTFDRWPGYAEPVSSIELPGYYLKQLEAVA